MSDLTEFQKRFTRQLDLLPIEVLGEPITIIGAGAIGSWTTLALAKMGFANLTVFDFDKVDVENMNCSLYPVAAVGSPKAAALENLIYDFTGIAITAKCEKYESGCFKGIVIPAVDSMAVRSLVWKQHKMRSVGTKRIIDPRMGAETALCYVMNPMDEKDVASYEKTLYTDDQALREPCTRKATAYCALALSGLVASQVKAIVTGNPTLRTTYWDIPAGAMSAFKG